MRKATLAAAVTAAFMAVAGCVSTNSTVSLSAAEAAAIRTYATTHFTDMVGGRAARVGCGFRTYGGKRSDATVTAYLTLLCEGEVAAKDCSSPGSAGDISIPTVVTLRGGSVTSWRQPGEDDEYWPDIKRLFPRALRTRVSQPSTSTIGELTRQVRTQLDCPVS